MISTPCPPFTFALQLSFQMLSKDDGNITIVYGQDANVRHVRMNGEHPKNLVPSPMGDSVGHWEGDTLIIWHAAERRKARDRTLPPS